MKRFLRKASLLLSAASLLLLVACQRANGPTIGFVVKQPEEPWFQMEWKFADQAAAKYGFRLVKIGAPDGEKALAAIDNLAASGAQGVIICIPDVKLGTSVARQAAKRNMKLLAVDDRFVGSDGKYMEEIHYLGISARKIGQNVGKELLAEAVRRGWNLEETGVCSVTLDELDTARDRTEGAIEALVAGGFPKSGMFKAPLKSADMPAAFDTVSDLLIRKSGVKRWLVHANNDNSVLGAVRALEGRGFGADKVIAIGINGTDSIAELRKKTPTGFFGSMLLSAREHGYRTSEAMYRWITEGKEPEKDVRTEGIFITRENFERVLVEQGIESK